jgi:hypothetical protein
VSEWQRETVVECVACPDCAFTFDARQEDTDGGYTCPQCAENEMRRQLHATRRVLDGASIGDRVEIEAVELRRLLSIELRYNNMLGKRLRLECRCDDLDPDERMSGCPQCVGDNLFPEEAP